MLPGMMGRLLAGAAGPSYASLVYVGGQVDTRTGDTAAWTLTFALTGGTDTVPLAGDLVVITYGQAATVDADMVGAMPSGYTQTGTEVYIDEVAGDINSIAYYKFMPGTPETTVILGAIHNSSRSRMVAVSVWRNVDTGTPMDVTTVTASGQDTTRADPGSITPSTPGAVVLAMGVGVAATISSDYTSGLTAFLSERVNAVVDGIVGSGYSTWTSGALDPGQFSGGSNTASDAWAAYTIALRPATL